MARSDIEAALAEYIAVLGTSAEQTNRAEDRMTYQQHLAAAALMFAVLRRGEVEGFKAVIASERHAYGWDFCQATPALQPKLHGQSSRVSPRRRSRGAPSNRPLQRTNGSVASLPLPFAAERQYRWTDQMYRIPNDLDLSAVVGEFTTQVRVGQFDLQFTFGPVNFAVQSPVTLLRDGTLVARWEEGRWPDPGFYEIMNTEVRRCEVVNDRLIALEFSNGIVMHLEDSSDQYESMQITFEGNPSPWII